MINARTRRDVVIIGSGISALVCAAILGKKGRSVTVLEQYRKPGGYLHCFSRFGARFDTGAHYAGALEPGQAFHTLLSYIGAYSSELFIPLDETGFDVFRFPDFETSFAKGYAATISRLSEQFPGEAGAIREYFGRIEKTVRYFPTYVYSDQTEEKPLLEALETSLETVVERLTDNPLLRCVFYSYCALHGVHPKDVAFGLHAILTDSLIQGPFGFPKGGDGLAQKLVEVIEGHGGEVLTRKKVVRIENQSGSATAVICEDGDRREAEWFISGIHPKQTFPLLDDPSPLSPAFRDRLTKFQESGALFGIYAACKNAPDLSPLRNYFAFASQDPERLLVATEPSVDVPNSVFLCSASRTPLTKNHSFTLNIHAAGPHSWFEKWEPSAWNRRPEDYEKRKDLIAEQVFNAIDLRIPGVRSTVTEYVTSTSLTNLHFNGTPEGSAYGIYHSIQNTGARALGPRTHIANLLLTGQNTLFPGLIGAATSALRTAGHIVGIKPLLRELKELGQSA